MLNKVYLAYFNYLFIYFIIVYIFLLHLFLLYHYIPAFSGVYYIYYTYYVLFSAPPSFGSEGMRKLCNVTMGTCITRQCMAVSTPETSALPLPVIQQALDEIVR